MIESPPTPAVAVVLQSFEVEGGSPAIAVATLLLAAVSVVLAVGIAYRLYAGYRGTGDRAQLALAVGLLLLTAVPTGIRFAIPTFTDGFQTIRILVTSASELLGLVAILYAVRGPPARRRRSHRVEVRDGTAGVVALPLAAVSTHLLGLLAQGATAVLGTYVAWLAYRGYRRNGSRPMAFLATGVLLLTAVSFVAMHGAEFVFGAQDATVLLVGFATQVAGLASVLYSLTRA